MKFEDFQIDSISDLMTEDRFGWVSVSIIMTYTTAEAQAAHREA